MNAFDIYATATLSTRDYTEGLSRVETASRKTLERTAEETAKIEQDKAKELARIDAQIARDNNRIAQQMVRDNKRFEAQKEQDARRAIERKARDAEKYERQQTRDAQRQAAQRARDAEKYAQQIARDERKYAQQRARDAERYAIQKANAEKREAEKSAREQQKLEAKLLKEQEKAQEQRVQNIKSASSKMVSAVKVVATGIAAATAGVAALTTKSVQAYGQYQQLTGGIEKIFGASAKIVDNYAANAFRTAQMSANSYMDLTTSFSASLVQALGGDTAAAAEMANLAISDMADNWNMMGTSAESVQDAYKGFAKQNYDMLDNLKLGYGGTASEMARLINDAGTLGRTVDESLEGVTFADIVTAIHQVQVNMNIAGTSSKEAASTIQGSIAMMKAAWENFLTGLGNPDADISALADNLMVSIEAVANNIVPVVERIFTSFSNVMTNNGPEILGQLIKLINSMAPGLITATVTLLLAIAQALVDNIDLLLDGVMQLIEGLCQILLQPEVISSLLEAVVSIIAALGMAILNYGFPAFAEVSTELVSFLINSFVDLFVGSAYYAAVAMNDFLSGLMNGIHSFFDGIGDWFVGVGENIVNGIVQGLQGGAQFLWDALDALSFGLLGRFAGNMEIHSPSRKMRKMGRTLPQGLGLGIDDDSDKPVSAMESIADRLSGGFGTSDIGYGDSAAGGIHNAISAAGRDGGNYPSTIVVQSVLDGRVIGETSYKYNRQISRALGV